MKRILLLLSTCFLLTTQIGFAGSATWTGAFSDNWDRAENWNPATVPNGQNDIATFDVSDRTVIDLNAFHQWTVDSIVFNPSANAFTVGVEETNDYTYLILTGSGIINNSGIAQKFVIGTVDYQGGGYPDTFFFMNSASAGAMTQFTVLGTDYDEQFGGVLSFEGSSTAGSALITDVCGESFNQGATVFHDFSSAENATIVNEASATHAGANLDFYDNSGAGNATITNNGALTPQGGGGEVTFRDSSDAANSTIICKNGAKNFFASSITFRDQASGGTARIILLKNSVMYFYGNDLAQLKTGSIEGNGTIVIGSSGAGDLAVGTNNRSSTFAGHIQESPAFPGSSFSKTGAGRLTLTRANTYTGGTTVESGTLLINNRDGSGTGPGNVYVKGGTFGGDGTVAGAVIVGTGNGNGAFFTPGAEGSRLGTLTIQSKLTLRADSTCKVTINSAIVDAAGASTAGAKIINAVIALRDIGDSVLPPGTVFTVIDNTASSPISGHFTNLADGGTIIVGSNTFEANYEGGDGNDLTLTVVP